jgi:DNA-binding MarR family transcriptional regulator
MRTSGAVTNRLHRLERRGLVTRVPDPHDGRGLKVRLTPRGRRLIDRAAPPHLASERDLLQALSGAEQQTLARLLKKLLLSIEGE